MYTIVFADDEENIRKSLIAAVNWEELGFQIIGEASNGIEALDLVERLEPDLLVSDIKMPFMSGIELVRAIREIRPNTQVVFLSGYDQFEYAKQAIKYNILEYLLKPLSKSDIIKEFTNIRKEMDNKFSEILNIDETFDLKRKNTMLSKRLYFDNIINKELDEYFIEEQGLELDMKIPIKVNSDNDKFVLYIAKSHDQIKSKEDNKAFQQVYNVMQIVSQKYYPCECFTLGNHVVIVAHDNENVLNKCLKFMSKDVVLTTKRTVGVDVFIGVSQYFTDLRQLPKAYVEARDAVNYISGSDEQIIYYNDISKGSENTSMQNEIEQYEDKIRSGNREEMSSYINEFFVKMNGGKLSQSQYNMYVLELLFLSFKALKTVNMDTSETAKLINGFSLNRPRHVIESEVKKLTVDLLNTISSERQTAGNETAEKAIQMIKSDYTNPEMNLNLISDTLHVSPNYLSSLIKKRVGDSFVNILTAERMKHAKQLLLTTNKKIMEVAIEVGYVDQHYFSYCFKKHFNVSPNKIREK